MEDFIVDEQKSLKPKQEGMYDEESWERFLNAEKHGGWINDDERYPMPTTEQLKNLENEDFSGGTTVSYEQMDLFGGKKW